MNKVRNLLFTASAVTLVVVSGVAQAQKGVPQTGEVIDLLMGGCLSCDGQGGWPAEWCTCDGNIE